MYLLRKLSKHIFLKRALGKSLIAPGLYFLEPEARKYDCVLIDASNPLYNHLGDQLFYQPLLHHLIQRGIPVAIAPTNAMQDYFDYLYGAKVVNKTNTAPPPGKNPLVIMSLWAYKPHCAPKNASLLLVDLTDPGISLPLSIWMVSHVSRLLHAEPDNSIDISPFLKEKLSGYGTHLPLSQDEPIAIFNNYVDSGKFRINFGHQKALATCARELRAGGLKIMHVGSAKDMQNDTRKYNFVDYDVRGKMTPLELMACFYRQNVICSITFDNFIMHTSLLADKPAYVRFRGRYTHAARQHHYLHVNQAFANVAEKSLIRYI